MFFGGITGDAILKKIAVEITDKLRKSTTVDWQVRESVRARLRILCGAPCNATSIRPIKRQRLSSWY